MCALASYGPTVGLSPCASPGYGNARLVSSISCENVLFFRILILMHTEPVWVYRRLNLLKSEFWVPSLA